MARKMSRAQAVAAFHEKVRSFRTQREAAADMGCSDVFISDMMAGKRNVSERALEWAGYVRVEAYEPAPTEAAQ